MKLTSGRLLTAYVIIALLSFGHAASSPVCNKSKYQKDCRVMNGIAAGVTWPLYWTWVAFDAGRAALAKGGE